MPRWLRELGPPLLGVAVLLVVWGIAAALTDTSAIPSPADTWAALRDGIADGSIPSHGEEPDPARVLVRRRARARHRARPAARRVRARARSIRPLVVALQIIPFVAWVPLAVIWFGVTERAVVFVAIAGSFPSVALATLQGIRQVPPLFIRAGRTLGASGWTLQREVVFPRRCPPTSRGSSRRGASRGRR